MKTIIDTIMYRAAYLRTALLLIAVMTTSTVWATDFITDIMLVGGSDSKTKELISSYQSQGWKYIDKDLNDNCGAATDYVYLLYKTADGDTDEIFFITDFYISSKSDYKSSYTISGRTYYLASYDGGDHFKSKKGDLNSNAGGDDIHLYYTKDAFSDRRGVTSVYFDDKKSGAVGENGGSTGYDLNSGAAGDYIYMHFQTATLPELIPNPLYINSVDDWNKFANYVNSGRRNFKDRYVVLNDDIGPVTEVVGVNGLPFCGTFYGNNHTINVAINSSAEGAAPFGCINGATIVRLNVTGTVTGGNHSSGLVGLCGSDGPIVIEECFVAADVNSPTYAGGIVGHGGHNQLKMLDCIYSGTISGFGKYAGGLIGWCDALNLTLKDCQFKGGFAPAGGKYHPIACKNGESTVTATVDRNYYPNTITPSAGLGNVYIPGVDGTPYDILYDFDEGANGWTTENGAISDAVSTGLLSSEWHSYHNCFKFAEGSQDQYLISPALNGYGAVNLTFYLKGTDDKEVVFEIGTSTTTNDPSDFKWFGEQRNTIKNWSPCVAQIAAGAKYVAIKYVSGSSEFLIDDIFIEESPYTPQELATTALYAEVAKVQWVGNSDTYNVQYRKAYHETFDEGTFQWKTRNLGGTANTNWILANLADATGNKLHGHNGDIVAAVKSKDDQDYTIDNWFLSPEVTLDGTLTFWTMDLDPDCPHFEVFASTTTNDNISDYEFVAERTHASAQYVWTEVTVDLSKYKGVKGYLSIRVNDTGKNYLFLDDVSIHYGDWTSLTTTEAHIVLTGLTPLSGYELQVQGVKGDKTTEWSNLFTFSTKDEATVMLGDVNSDGTVDISDYIGVANHILGNTPAGFNAKAADVNNDGEIDISDYIGVANIILIGKP